MKKTISVLIILLMLLTFYGCNKPKYQTTVETNDIIRLDVSLLSREGPECAPLVIRDPEQIKAFAEFINNAPIIKTKSVLSEEQTDGIPDTIFIRYADGSVKAIELLGDSEFEADSTIYTVQSQYLLKLCNAIDNIAYIPDIVTVGELANMLSYTGIKTEADRNDEYKEVEGFGWDTSSLTLTEVLTPQNAKQTIDAFLKCHFYTLETDVLAELSLAEKAKLSVEDANNICDALARKLKELTPQLSLDVNAVAKAEILDKSNVESPKSLTVTGEDLAKLVDYLNKTPITNVDFVGVASGIYKSVALFDKDGNEIFRADVNGDGFANGYCQYSVDNNYLGAIFDNVK